MRLIPIGIAFRGDMTSRMSPTDYSDDRYEGVQLRKAGNNDTVLIMHSKRDTPLKWKVVHGLSTVFFGTLVEAVAYCEKRRMKLIRETPI